MHSFIALTKKSNFQTMNSGTLWIDSKQQSRRGSSKLLPKFVDALTQKISETLTALGFKRITPQTFVDKPVLDDEQVSNFMPLDYLGAYVVSSSDQEKIKEAQESFDKSNYDVISRYIPKEFTDVESR